MNNNGKRRTSLRLQSKIAKSTNHHHTSSTKTSSSTSTIISKSEDTNENAINKANQDNIQFAMILRSNLLINNSSQEINKNKIFKIGKISDKKLKLKAKKSVKNTINTNKKRRKIVKKQKEKKSEAKKWPRISCRRTLATTATSSQEATNSEDITEEARPTTSSSAIEVNTEIINAQAIPTLPIIDQSLTMNELKFQLKKATVKFNKACRQLTLLDQHMSDLQNSYSNAVENDRKTFKIVFRMQLATLEGTHNAYIEYIERQVEKIKKLKQLLFTDNINQHLNNQTL